MKKLLLILILPFFSAQSFAGSCPDGSDPVKSISADGSYFVYNCGVSNNNTSTSTNSSSSAGFSSILDKNSLRAFFKTFNQAYDVEIDYLSDPGFVVTWEKFYERGYFIRPYTKAMAIAYPKNNIKKGMSGFCYVYQYPNKNQAQSAAIDCCETRKDKAHTCSILFLNNEIVNKDYLDLKSNSSSSSNVGADEAFNLYQNGDYIGSFKLYKILAENGNAIAQYNVGQAYREGKGVLKSDKLATQWYKKSAEQGYAEAQYFLGMAYYEGKGIIESRKSAITWLLKAAEQELSSAQLLVGLFYTYGYGVEKSKKTAAYWVRLAYENGSKKAEEFWNDEKLWKYE